MEWLGVRTTIQLVPTTAKNKTASNKGTESVSFLRFLNTTFGGAMGAEEKE